MATARGVCSLAWQLTWPLRADLNVHGMGRDFPWHGAWRLKLRDGARLGWSSRYFFFRGPPGEAWPAIFSRTSGGGGVVIFVDFHTKSVIFSWTSRGSAVNSFRVGCRRSGAAGQRIIRARPFDSPYDRCKRPTPGRGLRRSVLDRQKTLRRGGAL